MTEQEAHAPYLDAVAAALTAAGIRVIGHHANPDDPRNGAIELADPESRPLTLSWDEECGWYRGVSRADGHGELSGLYESTIDLLASPTDVARWVHSVLAGNDHDSRMTGQGSHWRYFDDDDDFDHRLREAGR